MVVHSPDEQHSLNKELNRFVDYFFTCGLSETEKPSLYKHTEEPISPDRLHTCLNSSVLLHFPTNLDDNPWNSAELWKLCSPKGLSVFVGDSSPWPPHSHSFLITREDGTRTYGHILSFFEPCVNIKLQQELKDLLLLEVKDGHMIYVEKSFGFITQLGLIRTCEKMLNFLHKLFISEVAGSMGTTDLPIESYLYNILYEVPVLSPGLSIKISCFGHDDPVIVQQPDLSELPLLDVRLTEVIDLVGGAKNLINLLTSLLLEHQILLVSEDSKRMMTVAEGVTSLLFPFQWQHTHVSVLSYEVATHFFDAPVPYIIGVLANNAEKTLIRQAVEVNQCYVDLDNAVVESPEDQPIFPNYFDIVHQIDYFLEDHQNEECSLLDYKYKKRSQLNDGHLDALSTLPIHILMSIFRVVEKKSYLFKPQQHLMEQTPLKKNIPMDNNNSPRATGGELDGVISNELISEHKPVDVNPDDDLNSLHANVSGKNRPGTKFKVDSDELQEQVFNISVRETIAATFLAIFSQYDKFIIHPNQDENGSWNFSTDTQDNFDKTSFLSDQPESHLRFLFSFLDTQMFASFIDNAVIAHQSQANECLTKDNFLQLFDDRIEHTKLPPEMRTPASTEIAAPLRSLSVSSASFYDFNDVQPYIKKSKAAVKKRLSHIELVSCPPHVVHPQNSSQVTGINIMCTPGTFPSIQNSLLESEGIGSKKRHLRRQVESRVAFRQPSQKWRKIQQARSKLLRQPSMSEYSPEVIAQTNWKFVEKLLRDVKLKTKKILVGKMGQEAIELGHGELCISHMEENTWIASLCDLLEKVWSHGLLTSHKKGKSSLWSHLNQYEVQEQEKLVKKQTLNHLSGSSPSLLYEAVEESATTFDRNSSYYSLPRTFQRKRNSDVSHRHQIETMGRRRASEITLTSNHQVIPPVKFLLLSSIRRICSMRDVQTEVGRSRAWIKLALEQKQLHAYLRDLLSNRNLLNLMYKRYSLLQCDDQCEQFLIHLLSLNAAEFNCFTNSFPKTVVEYEVWIIPGRQFAGASQTSANVYMKISGEQNDTEIIAVPRNCLEFTFKHLNLGILSTLTIGHDNSGILPKWLLDCVVARNQFTGQTYVFPCNRWLGKNVDDNSIERLLLAEAVSYSDDITTTVSHLSQLSSKRVTISRTVAELQENVGQAINDIFKFFHKHSREQIARNFSARSKAPFTKLIHALVVALEGVFTHGMKTGNRLFSRRRFFALDVIAATHAILQGKLSEEVPHARSEVAPPTSNSILADGGDWFLGNRGTISSEKQTKAMKRDSRKDRPDVTKSRSCLQRERKALDRFCVIFSGIFAADSGGSNPQLRLGKDDVFYLLILIGIKEHLVTEWLPKISEIAQTCTNIYEDTAFLCDGSSIAFLCQVLGMLWKYEIPLDKALLRGYHHLLK